MTESITQLVARTQRIAVKGPFDEPLSDNVCRDAQEIAAAYCGMQNQERQAYFDQVNQELSSYEKRSLLARVTTLCEEVLTSKDVRFFQAASLLYELGSARSDWRESLIAMAVFRHTLKVSDEVTQNKIIKEMPSFFPKLYSDFKESLTEPDSHMHIDLLGLELKETDGRFRFQPKG